MADGGVGPADGAEPCAAAGDAAVAAAAGAAAAARDAAMRAGVSLYSDELADAVCGWAAQGRSLRWIAAQPGMPHRTTIRNWANSQPEFSVRLVAAMRTARLQRRAVNHARAQAAAARKAVTVRGGRTSSYTPEIGQAICARIANGESVVRIAADPAMPCAGTIYGWARKIRGFEDMYAHARQLQAEYLFDEAREVAKAATPATVWVDRLRFDVIRWQAAKLAPRLYVERVVAAELAAEAKRVATDDGVTRILMTSFERSPIDPSQVLAFPPRNAEEAAAYEAAYGEPYSGPDWLAPEDDDRLRQAHNERRRRRLAELGRPEGR